ncbi:response regulator [bacterium]|nr:response regulator [bacterium]
MRNYLFKYFEIYESENGLEGLNSLKKNVDTELIVSDIMIPEIDDLTFYKRVKTNITTSHIPMILTTARRTKKNFIEGYEAQADSYSCFWCASLTFSTSATS